MNVISILAKVPWREAIILAPQILEKGNKIIDSLRKGGSIEQGLEDLAELQTEQAKLLETLSESNQQLSEAVKLLADRQRFFLQLVCASGALALVALGVAIFT